MGVKECTGNDRIQGYSKLGISCWSGNDNEAHAARHEYGGFGVISVASNLVPGLYSRLMEQRDDDLMDELQARKLQLCLALWLLAHATSQYVIFSSGTGTVALL